MNTIFKYLTILFSLSASPLLGEEVKYVTINSTYPMYARTLGMRPIEEIVVGEHVVNQCKAVTLSYTQTHNVILVYYDNPRVFGTKGPSTTCYFVSLPKSLPTHTEINFEFTWPTHLNGKYDVKLRMNPQAEGCGFNLRELPGTVTYNLWWDNIRFTGCCMERGRNSWSDGECIEQAFAGSQEETKKAMDKLGVYILPEETT